LIYCVCWIFVMNFLIVEGHGWFTGVFQFWSVVYAVEKK
jgi:hypothetical protein